MSVANEVDGRLERKALYFVLRNVETAPSKMVREVYDLLVDERDRYGRLMAAAEAFSAASAELKAAA